MLAELIDFAKTLEKEEIYLDTSYEKIPERLVVFKITKLDGRFSGEFIHLSSREEVYKYFKERPELLKVIKNLHYYSDTISGNKSLGSKKGFATGSPYILRYPKKY